MKVKKKLNVSSEQYFEFLIHHLLKEIPKTKKRSLNRNDLQAGFTYTQEYDLGHKKFESCKTIVAFDYGSLYHLQIEIPQGMQYIKHEVRKINENTIEVSYSEWVEVSIITGKIAYALQMKQKRKQMKMRLKAIESYVLKQNEAEE